MIPQAQPILFGLKIHLLNVKVLWIKQGQSRSNEDKQGQTGTNRVERFKWGQTGSSSVKRARARAPPKRKKLLI